MESEDDAQLNDIQNRIEEVSREVSELIDTDLENERDLFEEVQGALADLRYEYTALLEQHQRIRSNDVSYTYQKGGWEYHPSTGRYEWTITSSSPTTNTIPPMHPDVTQVTIHSTTTSLDDGAFAGRRSIRTIDLPPRILSMGDGVFADCVSLTSAVLPPRVSSLGIGAFCDCSALVKVELPKGMTQLKRFAFAGCTSLSEITIPGGVDTVGHGVFQDCTSLVKVVLPPLVTTVVSEVFYGCTSLTSVTLSNQTLRLGCGVFADCTSLTTILLPPTLVAIGNGTFSGCSLLSDITIPDSVTTVGDFCFHNCTSLTSMILPDSLMVINDNVFDGCSSLRSVRLGRRLRSMCRTAFEGCVSLKTVTAEPFFSTNNFLQTNDDGDGEPINTQTTIKTVISPETALQRLLQGAGFAPVDRTKRCLSPIEIDTVLLGPRCTDPNCVCHTHRLRYKTSTSNSNDDCGCCFEEGEEKEIENENSNNDRRNDNNADNEDNEEEEEDEEDEDENDEDDNYFEWKIWARTRRDDGRLPLMATVKAAAAEGLRWRQAVEGVWKAHMPAAYEVDSETGLEMFMTAAVGENSDLETAYRLLREYPAGIRR